MTTTTVKTIGTGGDYTTLQAWEDASPANLVTSDVVWQGQCFNQEFFSSSATLLTVSGTTTDATRYKELTTYAGASFVDNASVQTNALRYNASNGAGIRNTYAWSPAVSLNESYFRISKLQISGSANAALSSSASDGLVVDKCIFEASSTSVEPFKAYGTGTVKNSLFIQRSTNLVAALSNGTNAYNCTFARTGTGTASIIRGSYSTSTLKNCAFFGGATTLASGSSTRTYTTCYTDTASPPSGCTTVAYDTSTGSGFENKTDATRDFRIKSTSAMVNAGTTDATNAATDIAGTARPSGAAYDVGAWELVVAGGDTYTLTADSGSFALTGQTVGLAFNRILTAGTQSYALTGQDAGLAFNRMLSAASGSFILAGHDAGLAFNRVLSAANGSYALAGQDATLTYTPISGATYTLGASSGSFALTGQDTGLAFNRVLAADTQGYSLAGQAAGLAFNRVLVADTTSFALTGQDATLTYTTNGYTYTLSAESGSFALDGQDVGLSWSGDQTSYAAEVDLTPSKWYIKRNKKILLFNNAQEADAFIEAEEAAGQAIHEAQKTSRRARKRLRDKIITVEPAQTVDVDQLAQAVERFSIPVDLPYLLAQQDFDSVMQIMAMAMEMQDEEDIELLLLA